jgi:hypothetical protein
VTPHTSDQCHQQAGSLPRRVGVRHELVPRRTEPGQSHQRAGPEGKILRQDIAQGRVHVCVPSHVPRPTGCAEERSIEDSSTWDTKSAMVPHPKTQLHRRSAQSPAEKPQRLYRHRADPPTSLVKCDPSCSIGTVSAAEDGTPKRTPTAPRAVPSQSIALPRTCCSVRGLETRWKLRSDSSV